jgi:hypothetical protein
MVSTSAHTEDRDMTDEELQEGLIRAAEQILLHRHARDEADAKLRAAMSDHAALIERAVTQRKTNPSAPSAPQPAAATVPASEPATQHGQNGHANLPVRSSVPIPAPDTVRSVRVAILKFLEPQRNPLTQDKIEDMFEAAGYERQTVRQALYDMTSTKVGTLTRAANGISINDGGRTQLAQLA